MSDSPSRGEIALEYLEALPYEPYPVQERALLEWFSDKNQGVLVTAPTGTGKTLIAEGAIYEALRRGTKAYYTTPLIALTDQKFRELREAAVRWGFSEDKIGLVTGNRRINPDAPVLVVVAEILFNRLLHKEAFDFSDVSSVVMDEFHSFNDLERGIVWELSLGLLPEHVRTMLLSATVGNSAEFAYWLDARQGRKLTLVESTERRVPLTFKWVGDMYLFELLEEMATGDDALRKTPALVFCFNRDICWNVAEQMKGKALLAPGQQDRLIDAIESHDWSQGAGPKIKQILLRGVGIHHAGVLPKYRLIVEELFQQKLLSVCICTETLAAGINLPARSVVLPTILHGPPNKKRLIEPSQAHQMFGRAGRPQFDKEGFVYALAHEDDVKILRWKVQYDQIPEDTKDPGLLKAKKALKKKMPKRREGEAYWNEDQFAKLVAAPAASLESKGPLPWRMLAYMLDASPELDRIREFVSKRLQPTGKVEQGLKALQRMLMTLYRAGYVTLEPRPPLKETADDGEESDTAAKQAAAEEAAPVLTFGQPTKPAYLPPAAKAAAEKAKAQAPAEPVYKPERAIPTETLYELSRLRGVNPLYGRFVIHQLGGADRVERIQAIESVLEMPGSVAKYVRVPWPDDMPPGPLATNRLDLMLLDYGIVSAERLGMMNADKKEEDRRPAPGEERVFPLTLGEKLLLLFRYEFPGVDVAVTPVWCAGECLEFNDFNRYIVAKGLQKQEGVIFRHLLRMILMCDEFTQIVPPEVAENEWYAELDEIADRLTVICNAVDSTSTQETLAQIEMRRQDAAARAK